MNSKSLDEQQLIAACKQRKPWAQKMLYEQYAPAMLSLCVRYTGDRETARDLLQDGFIKIFHKIDTYSGKGSFEGWIRRIFVTTSLEYLRNNSAFLSSVNIDDYDYLLEDTDTSIIEKISADDLMKCISELPAGFRTVFNLYTIEGYSHAEIADILHIKESTSRSQFGRARQILQKNIQSSILYDRTKKSK